MVQTSAHRGPVDLLAIAFATVVAMWSIGYVTHMPFLRVPGWVTAAALLCCLLAGGWATGRLTPRGGRGGAGVGLLTAAVNMLVLGSKLGGDRPGEIAESAVLWVPASFLSSVLLAAGGGSLGALRRRKRPPAPSANWTHRFAVVAVVATGLLLIAGGLVTAREAGLAVEGWPASFGYSMFLYPLKRMTGNIYFEHAHRLYGALVGLTTIVLAAHLVWADERRWMKGLALVAVVAVVGQGVMGGLRVTGAEGGTPVARPEDETAATVVLRVAHGVFAQVFLGLLAAIAAFTSAAWRRARPEPHPAGATDRNLTTALLGVLLAQLAAGAVLRHTGGALRLHVTLAAAVVAVGGLACARAWVVHRGRPPLPRLGSAVVVLTLLQLALGIAALVARHGPSDAPPSPAETWVTTAHQANGAALLASAVALMALTHRQLRSGPAVVVNSDAGRESPRGV